MLDELRIQANRELASLGHTVPGLWDWDHVVGVGKGKRARHVYEYTCEGCYRKIRIETGREAGVFGSASGHTCTECGHPECDVESCHRDAKGAS